MLMKWFWNVPKDEGWLAASGANSMMRGLELSVSSLDLQGGEKDWRWSCHQ